MSLSGERRTFPTAGEARASDLGGHAVVLVAAGPDYLEFLNSWGPAFGNNGRFRIRDAAVLRGMKFYDVFFVEGDLLASEKEAWRVKSEGILRDVRRDYPRLAEYCKF